MDLSKLLGDLYETNEVDAPVDTPLAPTSAVAPSARPAPGPEWADEALLDEAFASWRPGPPDDAPAAEREMANGFPGTDYPELEGVLSHDELGALVTDRDQSMAEGELPGSAQAHAEAGETVDTGPARMWTRADDDVLTHRRSGGRRLKLSLRRR